MEKERVVEFSARYIELINHYNVEGHDIQRGLKAFQQKNTYYVQNKCNTCRKLRVSLSESSDPAYELLRGTDEHYLAAGLKLPVVLQYSPSNSKFHLGEIIVYVDDEPTVAVPIKSILPMPCLEVCPSVVDFGNLVCEHQITCQPLTLTNTGSKQGDFMLLGDQLPSYFKLSPTRVTLSPGESVDVKVELLCKTEGSFSEHLRITTDDAMTSSSVILRGALTTPQLRLLDPSDSSCSLERVAFGNVYYGTTVSRKVLLFNDSPVSTQYLVVLNTDAEGAVDGLDANLNLATVWSKSQKVYKDQSNVQSGETLLQIVPMQGSLDPYEKKMLKIIFAPQFEKSCLGWTHHQSMPIHKDFALFVQFLHIGASNANVSQGSTSEIAVTGTARPLQLTIRPGTFLDFGPCTVGQILTKKLLLYNASDVLPINFQCRQVAHYKCLPTSGRISPGQELTLLVTFQPKQVGPLNYKMCIDMMCPGKRKLKEAFHSVMLDFHGSGQHSFEMSGKRKLPTNLINGVASNGRNLALVKSQAAVHYTYVDPDYCYNSEEVKVHATHRQGYIDYYRERQIQRQWKKKEKALFNPTFATKLDLNMPPAYGLNSPMLSVLSGESSHPSALISQPPANLCSGSKMLTFKHIDDLTSAPLDFIEYCPSKPSSFEVSSQCETQLSPLELSQISFEPAILDFGSAVVDSAIEKTIAIKNFSQKHISVRMELTKAKIFCKKFGSNPRFILAPQSFTEITLSMQPGHSGILESCVWYSINDHHNGHLPVKANVNQLTLSLSTMELNLTEPTFASKTAGLRGSVRIANKNSVVASYQWHAMEGVDTNVFSATLSSGTIPAGSSLECEFVCLPSYDCPSAAQFYLAVGDKHSAPTTGAENYVLTLIPKINRPTCEFREKRLLLGTVPLNLTTIRTVHIENKGNCHAYFKIRNPSPHSGILVSCESGCVPIGGNVELKVTIKPEVTELFDVKLFIDLKGGRSIFLRITGTVEYPSVSISEDTFRFGGVYCGATATIPFTISNKGSVKVQLVFDLSYLTEFSLITPLRRISYGEGIEASDKAKGVFLVDLPGKSDAQCMLQFCPQTVASYDYQLPMLVNGMRASNSPSSSWPPSNACSTITLHPAMPMKGKIPSCRVLATVMRSPLLVSNTILIFSVHPEFLDKAHAPIEHQQVIKLSNISEHPISWALDYSNSPRMADKTFQFCLPTGSSATDKFVLPTTTASSAHLQPGEEFVFTALCCPPHHGSFDDKVPLILNADVSRPYRNIELRASLPAGRISVNPGHIVVQPVPLRVSVIAKFTVYFEYFTSPIELNVSLPAVEKDVNLVVTFPEDSTVYDIEKTAISCQLEFSSTKPISKSDYIIITDKTSDIRKRIPFTIVADNSQFTLYTLLANSISKSITRRNDYLPSLSLQPRYELLGNSGSNLPSPSFDDVTTCDSYTACTDISMQGSVSGICRWLSAYGWSNGVKSISSPLDFRIRVGEDLPKVGVKQRSNIGTSRGLLLDLLTHLCGRVPPGIPLNLPPCTTASEKVNQQYSTYDSVISFLRSQGGLMWFVVPESLLDYRDYQQWVQDVAMNKNISFNPQNEVQFNVLSQQAWTHLLMQIIKVLVLPRVIRCVPKYLEDKASSANDAIYSTPEKVLLAWLNFHYENQKKRLLRGKDSGVKQITNFDSDLMDSTVLACVLASYCPFLIETHFKQLYEHPSHPEQCSHNAIIFIRALKHVGIDYDIQPSDICSPNAISMILFTIHLYERMFTFKPKETLTFETVLGEPVNQQVQLENPTSKQMEYCILIRGEDAQDFHLTNDSATITLAGHQSSQLCLTFHGHNLNPSSATLFILARGNKSAANSVQAFQLSGYVSKAKPQFSTVLTASLYELQLISLIVTNPYSKSGFFEISLSESSDEDLLSSLVSADAETCMISTSSVQKKSDDQMHMFELTNQNKIFLEPGHTTSLSLKFVPLKLMPRHCAIILKNKKLGDIVLSVYVTVSLPNPSVPETRYLNSSTVVNTQTRTLHLKAHAGQIIEEEIIISSNNVAFENALLEISKWNMSQLETKQRIVSESFKYAILSTANMVLGRDDDQLEGHENIVFSVEGSDNKYFSFPTEIYLLANSKDVATVPIRFHADTEGQYECHLVLKSTYDVRVVIIESTVLSADSHTELEFKTKALLPLTQNIPLINPSTVDWPLVATLNATNFKGPEFITAQSLTTTPYPLTFSPHREGMVEGDLHLTNSTDKSEYVFYLKGVAERPIAQEHIKLCVQAKTSVTHILHVRNYHERTLVFQVESDLDFISGPTSITIGGHDVVDYPLLIVPKRQGIFTGAVAFVAQAMSRPHSFSESLETSLDNSSSFHIWFQVECTVNAAPPDRVMMVSCPVLSSSTFQLSVVNPQSYPLKLQVSLEGHGLSGPDHMEIHPNGEALYPLTFTPTLVGQTKGRVVFNCIKDGEFWYELDLFADNPKSTSISPISCELGKTCSLAISLTNPLDIPVRFKCNNTNTKHFIVTGLPEGQIAVEPHSSEDVHILFKPSAIGAADHSTELVFISEQFGRHVFLLQGNGISPQEMDPISIIANLGSSNVHVINFTNPLDTAMHFSISVKGEDSEHFCLLMRHIHSILLHPGVSLDVPVMFAPEIMRGHKANILIISDDEHSKHCWSYPVFGRPELRASSNLLNIMCRAKERFEQKFQVSLMSTLEKYDTTIIKSITFRTEGAAVEESYSYKLICHDNHLVEKCTGIQLTNKRSTNADTDAADTTILEFVLVFTPPKAFKCSCDLYITGREGAAWIFPLHLLATPAAPDDTIIMEAAGLNTETQVCLRLTSLTEHRVPYTAHMADNSDSDITVNPTSGELTPVDSQGTPLYITYKPRAYGRKHHAKLIVQSASNEWCYDIVGKVPTLPRSMWLNQQIERSPIKT